MTDVVNFSMGYYHETPTDAATDGPLRSAIDALTAAGVIVVAAAGNDATSTPFFPAAFAGAGSPLVSVGALNPDGSSVALFSNNGTQSAAPSWITTHAIGAGVVSTVPVTLSGGRGRSVFVDRNDPAPRATVDRRLPQWVRRVERHLVRCTAHRLATSLPLLRPTPTLA